jgi:hypothetical protein
VPEGKVKLFGTISASGIVVSSQNEGLRHETDGGIDALSTNLLFVPVESSSNPSGKAQKGLLLNGLGLIA